MTYKMILEYEGTRYNGWQRQNNTENTLQGIIEELLRELTGENVEVNASGRTDAGVHARGQCASFKLLRPVEPCIMVDYLNKALNKDVRIISIEEADPRFHARLLAKDKTYTYRIYTGDKAPVFTRRFFYHYPCTIDVNAIKTAAKALEGEHDFMSFCSNKRMKKSTVRTIYNIEVSYYKGELEMSFTGNGFLYNMVRILAGTLLKVGMGEISPKDIEGIIQAKNRQLAGPTLPSQGLMLEEVRY